MIILSDICVGCNVEDIFKIIHDGTDTVDHEIGSFICDSCWDIAAAEGERIVEERGF